MRTNIALIALLAALAPGGVKAEDSDWIFRPSYYSHSPMTGQRVAQYQPEEPALARVDPTYQESGYRHNETSIQFGDTADHLHIVQTWGQGDSIRPYGEWQYPFRAGATPYGPWGNPQGPWTLPFDSWQNPYGQGRFQPPGRPYAGNMGAGAMQPGMGGPAVSPSPMPFRGGQGFGTLQQPGTAGPASGAVSL